jgi:tetratricopeptide (TPR) repeat protein
MWAGELDQAVTHEQRACSLLDGTREQFFLAVSFWFLSLSFIMRGRFDEARCAALRTRSIGDAMADSQLRSYGSIALSWIATAKGDIAEGVTSAEQAVALAPDPLAEAIATILYGYARLERRDPVVAIDHLERAVAACRRMEIPYLVGWGSAWLADAERLAGRGAQARARAEEVLTLADRFGLPLAAGLAHRTLGLLAHAEANVREATTQLAAAIETFSGMGAQYEVARTRLGLAELAQACGDSEVARSHLDEACRLFEALDVPQWRERARELIAGPARD